MALTHYRRGLGAGIAALALLALGMAAAPAGAAPTPDSGKAAAGWLARQFVGGDHLESGGFADAGLTIDAVFAFAATKVSADPAAKATAWLTKPDVMTGYLGDGAGEVYAGAHAKLTLAAIVQGKNPASFGGVDLPAKLLTLQTANGRFSDKSQWGDFSNAFSQSLAIIALKRHAGAAPAPAVDFLIGSQCPDGGFPQNFGEATCASSVDATSFALQAALAVGRADSATKALDWLGRAQQPGGGFAGAPPTSAINANSTGLAAQALRVGGRGAAADKAVTFLKSLQVDCTGPEARRGAIAYEAKGFDPATAPRATAQAITGLVGTALVTLTHEGSAPDVPTLSCGTPPSATPSAVPSSSPSPSASAAPSVSPSASAVPSASLVPSASVAPSAAPSAAPSVSAEPSPVAGLPRTGWPIGTAVLLGALLLVAGIVLVAITRLRRTSQ